MTKNQPVNGSLFSIGSDLDDIEAQFERVRNSLFFFNEILDEAVDSMRDSDDCYVMNLIQRYDMLRHLAERPPNGLIAAERRPHLLNFGSASPLLRLAEPIRFSAVS